MDGSPGTDIWPEVMRQLGMVCGAGGQMRLGLKWVGVVRLREWGSEWTLLSRHPLGELTWCEVMRQLGMVCGAGEHMEQVLGRRVKGRMGEGVLRGNGLWRDMLGQHTWPEKLVWGV